MTVANNPSHLFDFRQEQVRPGRGESVAVRTSDGNDNKKLYQCRLGHVPVHLHEQHGPCKFHSLYIRWVRKKLPRFRPQPLYSLTKPEMFPWWFQKCEFQPQLLQRPLRQQQPQPRPDPQQCERPRGGQRRPQQYIHLVVFWTSSTWTTLHLVSERKDCCQLQSESNGAEY